MTSYTCTCPPWFCLTCPHANDWQALSASSPGGVKPVTLLNAALVLERSGKRGPAGLLTRRFEEAWRVRGHQLHLQLAH